MKNEHEPADDSIHKHVKAYSSLYKDVQKAVHMGLKDISDVKVSDPEARQYVEGVKKTLHVIKNRFDDEISFLENNSEWEKFTIAFFGETNAGKSTIIESLRIIFQEKARQKLIVENKANLEILERKYSDNAASLMEHLGKAYKNYATELETLSENITAIRDYFVREYGIRRQLLHYSLGAVIGALVAVLFLIANPRLAMWLGIVK